MPRYSVHTENGLFLVYDKQQDIFVDRFNRVYTEGYLTKAEATAVVRFLNNK